MREIISVHVGEAGIQVGNAYWELYCLEHGLALDGTLTPTHQEHKVLPPTTFFTATKEGKFVPRAVFVDLDDCIFDEVANGPFCDLYGPDALISGEGGAANNYARGYYSAAGDLIDAVMTEINKVVEVCETLQGFMLFRSLGGGTGSGFGSLLLERLSADYVKKPKVEFAVYPGSKLAASDLEPYNSVLATQSTLEYSDCTFLLDNDAIFEICQRNLDIPQPTYTQLNRMIAQVVSSITASMRFHGSMHNDLSEFQTNLVPIPRLHFPLATYAPIISAAKTSHEKTNVSEITTACFDIQNQMVKCDPRQGKYMNSCLLYRGVIVGKDVDSVIATLNDNKTFKFFDWCSKEFKAGICSAPPTVILDGNIAKVKRAVCSLSNTSAIVQAWSRLNEKFDLQYSKSVNVQLYLDEGMEECEFTEAREGLAELEKDYAELSGDVFVVLDDSPVFPARGSYSFARDIIDETAIMINNLEPYNSVLAAHSTLERSECTFLLINDAIFKIC
ncbi:hypothetical protein BGZ96_003230 [Linnemannia gamsii]|uniref:Tubulin alpha chain n=1 Tax=Linnemannia gamsii TaxID=64522 RepID=A0ABQ7JJH7_9FUNG|nr:hypothetical protein BGZ96_003230 [Linnemannia gamsii]